MATNITPGTAIAIASLPYAITLDTQVAGGIVGSNTTHAVWWKYLAPVHATTISILATAAIGPSSDYHPLVTAYHGPAAATELADLTAEPLSATREIPFVVPVTTGVTYYLLVECESRDVSDPLDSDLTLAIVAAPNLAIPAGSLGVTAYPDSRYPLTILSHAGAILRSEAGFAAGGDVATLDDGTLLIVNQHDQTLRLYDGDLAPLATVPLPFPSTHLGRVTSNRTDTFYVIETGFLAGAVSATSLQWTTVSRTGVVGPIVTIPIGGMVEGFEVNHDETILYINTIGPDPPGPPGAGQPLRRWDIAGAVVLAPLVAGDTEISRGDILAFPDGSVVAESFPLFPTPEEQVHTYTRYDAAGATIWSHSIEMGAQSNGLARIPGDTTSFWRWVRGSFNSSPKRIFMAEFSRIRVSDGAALESFEVLTFGAGKPAVVTGEPPYTSAAFGPDFAGSMWVTASAVASSNPPLPPVPVPPVDPPVPGVPRPCTPQTQVGNGGSGNSGCNTGGVGGVPQYTGPFGTVPAHDDPDDGESMVNARGIDLWVEIVHTDYPTGDTVTHRRAMVELADPFTYEGGRKQGGLLAVGDIEHGLGNEQGGFEAATVDISYADSADRLFRNLLADQELEGDEVRIKITTIEGRLAGVPPRVIARAVAQKPRLQSSLEASFSASDYLFSEFGPFGPGRQFPSSLIPQSIFPYATADTTALAIPVLYGEYSDEGAVDPLTNVANPKGLVPLIYVGPQAITTTTQSGGFPPYDGSLVPPPSFAVTALAQPIGSLTFHASAEHDTLTRYDATIYAAGTTAPVLDVRSLGLPAPNANDDITVDLLAWLNSHTPGNYDLTITAVSAEGLAESGVSNSFTVPVVAEASVGFGLAGPVNTDPYFAIMAVFAGQGSRLVLKSGVVHTTAPHNFRVTWTEAPQASEYWVFMYTAASGWDAYVNPQAAATVRYKRLSATPTNSHDPAWNYFIDFTSPTDGSSWPPPAATATTTTDDWDTYLLCGHAIFDILAVYASDLAAGGEVYESQRILIDPEARGDILCPFYSTWPFATTYRDFEDADGTVYRLTVLYARGPLSDAHKNGTINMVVNPIGIEDVGDGSGLPIIDAHAVQQHWLENFLLRDYRSGLGADADDYPQWEDGTPMVRSTSFADRQGFTQSSIGGRGLTVRWYASNQRVLQDWFREWNQSTDSRMGINSHGQIVVSGLDEFVDTTNWPRILHDTDLFGDVIIVSGEERENSVSGVCDWDPDKKQFRGKTIPYESQAAITKYKVRRKIGNKIESTLLYDEQQLRWVLQRRLRRLREGARTVEITGKVDLLDYDVGSGLLLNTIDGVGEDGYVDQPMLILRRRFKVSDRLVTLTLLDIGDFVIPAESQFVIVSEGSPDSGNPVLAEGGLLVTV